MQALVCKYVMAEHLGRQLGGQGYRVEIPVVFPSKLGAAQLDSRKRLALYDSSKSGGCANLAGVTKTLTPPPQ